MNRTLKALGLGLLAALAVSAFAVVGASANITAHSGGHFTAAGASVATPVTLHALGGPESAHQVKLHAFGSTVECTETYTSVVTASPVTSITITPHYTNCANGRIVHMNGCSYTFTVRDTNASTLHNAVHLKCPVGKKAEVTAPGECTITFGEQVITNAANYTNVIVSGVSAITAHVTAKEIKFEKHGLCEFVSPFGTGPHSGANGAEMTGTALLKGTRAGVPAAISATGRNNH